MCTYTTALLKIMKRFVLSALGPLREINGQNRDKEAIKCRKNTIPPTVGETWIYLVVSMMGIIINVPI